MKIKILILFLVGIYFFTTQWGYIFNNGCYSFDFLDVGQGDAILITTPTAKNILIDGGPSTQILDQLGAVMPMWDKQIDLVILTHPHADHLRGLLSVLDNFSVEQIYLTGATYDSQIYSDLFSKISEFSVNISYVNSGSDLNFDSLKLDIIYPETPYLGRDVPDNINDTSISGIISIDGFRFLFTGDAETEEESELLKLGQNLQANIFQAGHHGSRTSNSIKFLEQVKPEYIVIQAGNENEYGHPHQEAINNFEQIGADIYRTDLDGNINFKVCGGNIAKITTSR